MELTHEKIKELLYEQSATQIAAKSRKDEMAVPRAVALADGHGKPIKPSDNYHRQPIK